MAVPLRLSRGYNVGVLENFADLEGLVWQIPIPKGTDLSSLEALKSLRYLNIVQPKLAFDLVSFPDLEFFQNFFAETITGYANAKSLRSISMTTASIAVPRFDVNFDRVKF